MYFILYQYQLEFILIINKMVTDIVQLFYALIFLLYNKI